MSTFKRPPSFLSVIPPPSLPPVDEENKLKIMRTMEDLHEQVEYVSRLSPEIKASLFKYTITDYHEINEYLRGNHRIGLITSEQIQKHIENIDQAFALCPTTSKAFTVYRGQDSDIFNTKAYTSTTLDLNMTSDFFSKENRCCVFEISVSPGSKVLPLRNVSNFRKEIEILLDRDGEFFLTYVEEDDIVLQNGDVYPMRIIHLTYTGPVIQELRSEEDVKIFDQKQEVQEDRFVADVFNSILTRMTEIIDKENPSDPINDRLYDYAYQAYDEVRQLIGDKIGPLDRENATALVNAYIQNRR
jgi:hypothetical protein